MDAIGSLQAKRLLRVGEAAEILNVSRWTVYRWVEAGRLGGTRLGAGSLRVLSDTVAALIDQHYVGVRTPASLERSEHSSWNEQRPVEPHGISSDRSGLQAYAAG